MELYMEGRLKLEAKSYPYTETKSKNIVIENNVAYNKPMLEVINHNNIKSTERSLMIFDTTTELVDALMILYASNKDVHVVNGYVGV